jgi:hypothetical protein
MEALFGLVDCETDLKDSIRPVFSVFAILSILICFVRSSSSFAGVNSVPYIL